MNTIPFETGPVTGTPLRNYYENVAADTLLMLWRRRRMLATLTLLAVVLAGIALMFTERRYTSEAVFQLDFARVDAAKAGAAPPTAAMEAGALVEGEARIIRSRPMARRVVMRLGLEKDPAFAPPAGYFTIVRELLWPASSGSTAAKSSTRIDRATTELMKRVTVSNDTRSYLITIAASASTPVKAADVANAFATEYLQDRLLQRLLEAEAGAFGTLNELEKTFGDKHPSVMQARANLLAARDRVQIEQQSAAQRIGLANPLPSQLVSPAQPILVPAGPNTLLIFGLSIAGALAVGIGLSLLLEKIDNGFRTEAEVRSQAGVRCLGMIPMIADSASADRSGEQLEALRSLCLATGLGGRDAAARVVMITSSVPKEGKSVFASNLARALVAQGVRVLVLNASPRTPASGYTAIEDLIDSPDALQEFLDGHRDERLSRIIRTSGLNGSRSLFATPTFDRLRKEVLNYYDVLLIEAPPAIMLSDTVTLGRSADLLIHTARWNRTPRKTVSNAIAQLRSASIRIDGLVLTGVDLAEHETYHTGDQCYNFSKYSGFYKTSA